MPKIVNTALKAKVKASKVQAKAWTFEAKAKAKAIKFGLPAPRGQGLASRTTSLDSLIDFGAIQVLYLLTYLRTYLLSYHLHSQFFIYIIRLRCLATNLAINKIKLKTYQFKTHCKGGIHKSNHRLFYRVIFGILYGAVKLFF